MAGLKCPRCGGFTSFSPVLLQGDGVLVNESMGSSVHYAKVRMPAVTDGWPEYAILKCEACGERFVANKTGDWVAVYPVPNSAVAEEIPDPVNSEFQEANLCFAVGAYRGCLLVCRTALIDMQREQGVKSFKELVEEKGIISPTLYKQADEVRLWANTIGHEAIVGDIEQDDVEQLLNFVKILFDTIYVNTKKVTDLAQKRKKLTK